MKAPISVCIITRDCADDLDVLLSSIEDHVEEICVLDTGSDDPSETKRICEGRARVEVDTSFLDGGLMYDFAAARQRSFDMATQPWVMWLDSDDTLFGGEHLKAITETGNLDREKYGPGITIRLMYAYTFDEAGRCSQQFFRDRIVHRDDGWRWHRPIHEYLDRKGDATRRVEISPKLVHVKHMQLPKGGADSMRNLNILFREWAYGSDDPAIPYYIGNEMEVRGLHSSAFRWFDRCIAIELPEGHDCRRWQATALEHKSLTLANSSMCRYSDSAVVAQQLIKMYPEMRMGYMCLGRALLFMGQYALATEAFNKAYALEGKVKPSFPNPVLECKTMRLIASESCHMAGEQDLAREHLLQAASFAGLSDPQVRFMADRIGIELEAA